MTLELAELLRRFENLIRIGTIAEIDEEAARVRVKYDLDEVGEDVLTGWIRWGVANAGDDIEWNPPQVGEQVLFVSLSGDPSLSFVICSLYQDAHPAPETDPNKRQIKFSDGTLVEYDKSSKTLAIILATGGTLSIEGNIEQIGDLTMQGDLNITGNVDITGQLTINGTNFSLHTHMVTVVGSPTGVPQ